MTADVRQINAKHQAPFTEFNACRWLLFSNHRSAIPMAAGDRRFETVVCDRAPEDAVYYQRLYVAAKDPAFITAVGQYLQTRDISGFDAGKPAIMSAVKKQLIEAMQPSEVIAMVEHAKEYPYRLITAARLMAVCGLEGSAKATASFGHLAEDAGWIKVGRFVPRDTKHKRAVMYCRNEDAQQFTGATSAQMALFIPTMDGGEAVPNRGPAM